MSVRLVLAAALTCLIFAVPAAHSAQSSRGRPAAATAAKAKRKKCKKQTVAVTINGRKRCLPPKAALPAPKEADQRLLAVQSALGLDLSRIHDRRGRRPPSAKKLLGARGMKKLEKAVKQGLAAADRLSAKATLSTSLRAPAATASAERCGGGSGPPEQSQEFKGDGFQTSVDVSSGAAQIGVDLGEPGFRAELDLGLCELIGKDKLKIPPCPDANGELKGSDESLAYMRLKIFKGSTLLLKQSFSFKGETKIEPVQVDQDAKLEYFNIVHKLHDSIELGGTSQTFNNLSLSFTYTGEALVRYPGANYDPHHTNVEVNFNVEGIGDTHELREVEFDEGLKAKGKADVIFADEVEKVINKLHERQENWQHPNNCAKISFDPASRKITLKRNQAGQLKVLVESSQKAAPTGAKWTLLAHENAEILPDHALANPASFHYTVTDAGPGVTVSATFKAVSQAGVAEETWSQETKKVESIEHIEGDFGGEVSTETPLKEPSKQNWIGSVAFNRFTPSEVDGASGTYVLASGKAAITASGIDGTGITGCHQSGSTEATIPPGSGTIEVQGTGPEQGPPYTYAVHVSMPPTTIEITRHNCPSGASEFEGSTDEEVALWNFDVEGAESTDGLAYAGSKEETFGQTTFEQHWNMTGTP